MIILKRIGYIYDGICSLENIKLAILNSSKNKRNQYRVKKIISNINYYAPIIQKLLVTKSYIPSPYIIKTVHDGSSGKTRRIYKPRYFPDQIIHWALMQQIEPIIMRGMYAYSCGNVPKRGTSFGQNTLEKWLAQDIENTKYCLKLDIAQFYPSIDGTILKEMFRKVIKDIDCLWLIDVIINSSQGLPIGNYTSQWFSNFFLQGLDHYIKGKLQATYYIRYVDDIVILEGNKEKLHFIRNEISYYLMKINLKMKHNWQVFNVTDRAIDFFGLRFFRDKILLRKRNALRIKRRVNKIRKKGFLNFKDACAMVSYGGWLKRSNSYNLYYNQIKPIVSYNFAKRTVSKIAKLRNFTGQKVDFKQCLKSRV